MTARAGLALAASFGLALAGCGGGAGTGSPSDDTGATDASAGADGGPAREDASSGDAASSSTADGGPASGDGATCPSPVPSDPLASQRAACTFTAGALVKDTLGLDDTARAALPIKHVLIMMKENRSFDHLLGQLHATKPEVEAIPSTFSNVDAQKNVVASFHQTSSCIAHDPDHQWAAMHNQVDDGKMDGFVTSAATSTSTDGHFAMSYYDATDLPFYYWLASTYALDDRHFASVRSGTFPNRNFLLLGTNDGVQSTGDGYPSPSTPTIFQSLDKAGVTWGVYGDGSLLSGTLGWDTGHAGTGSFADMLQKLDDGSLPQVAFVDGIDDVTDDHPTANVQEGEAWSRDLYAHATASSLWPGMAMIWTYDEGGGFADHVPPPSKACVARPGNAVDEPYFELGVRIPLAVISPYARPGYTSHVVQEHTAVTRFIETVFGLPALTSRDANSDALLDLFDFVCPPAFLAPPPPPPAGTGGCDGVVLTVASPDIHAGQPISISFTGGPGDDAQDWIGVYSYPSTGPTPPTPGSLMYQFIGGTHTATTAPAAGTVVIDASAAGKSAWPLPVGGYIAYYLLDNGYTSVASIDFNVVP